MVRVVDCTSSPAFTLVRVCDRLKVPPSWACARVLEFSTGPLPWFTWLPDCALPLAAAALPPPAIDEPVPVGDVEVPPVPMVDAEVPPTAAEPPVPPVMLVCAASGGEAASMTASAVHLMRDVMA